MKNYYVGYMDVINKKDTFIILATTKCPIVAEYIERNYNKDYKAVGMKLKAVVHTKDTLPQNHKHST